MPSGFLYDIIFAVLHGDIAFRKVAALHRSIASAVGGGAVIALGRVEMQEFTAVNKYRARRALRLGGVQHVVKIVVSRLAGKSAAVNIHSAAETRNFDAVVAQTVIVGTYGIISAVNVHGCSARNVECLVIAALTAVNRTDCFSEESFRVRCVPEPLTVKAKPVPTLVSV